METHFTILAWTVPWMEEPGGLQSVGLHRVTHPRGTNTHTHTLKSKFSLYLDSLPGLKVSIFVFIVESLNHVQLIETP